MIRFIILFAVIISACQPDAPMIDFHVAPSYVGTSVILQDAASKEMIDTIHIEQEKFQVPHPAHSLSAKLIRLRFSDKQVLCWLEGELVMVDATTPPDIVITGSRTQEELNQLTAKKANLQGIDRLNADIDFCKTHPDNYYSAVILDSYGAFKGYNFTDTLYQSLSQRVRQSEFGERVMQYLATSKNLKKGDRIVEINLPDINGNMQSLNETVKNNRYTVLDFWTTGCGKCRGANKELSKRYIDLRKNGIEIFAVSGDRKKRLHQKSSKIDGVKWINTLDPKGNKGESFMSYDVAALPRTFLIDSSGIIVKKTYGISVDELLKL